MMGARSFPEESRGPANRDKDSANVRLAVVAEHIRMPQSSIIDNARTIVSKYLLEPEAASQLAAAKLAFDAEKDSGKKVRSVKHDLLWLEKFLELDHNEVVKASSRGAKFFSLIVTYLADSAANLDRRSDGHKPDKNDFERYLRYGTPLPTVPTDSSTLWNFVELSDFSLPEAAVNETIREFLRGKQRIPLWLAKHGSVWRNDLVQRILPLFEDYSFLILHGPAGHGKSVAAMQALAAWRDQGSTAIVVKSEAAFHDAGLELACRASPKTLILLDDISITRALPSWFNLQGSPTALVLQTTQTRRLDGQRVFLSDHAKRVRIPVPDNPSLFVDNLMKFEAAFSTERPEVLSQFSSGLGKGNYGGGLWAATWEATRGEKIDDRIGAIVAEIFDNPARHGDRLCIAAVAFLNGIIEYGQRAPMHSRLSVEPRRSTVASLIKNHPVYSQETKDAALESLSHIGAWLADELFVAGADPHILDLGDDPLIEFRSASVTHAFYRWLFGAFRGDGEFRVPRWQFYTALTPILVQRKAGPADFVGALRSLIDAWRVKPQYQSRYDHGRSQANLYELAREIYDACPHEALAAKCRLDAALARAMLIASQQSSVGEKQRKDLLKNVEGRLLAATVEYAPWVPIRSPLSSYAATKTMRPTSLS